MRRGPGGRGQGLGTRNSREQGTGDREQGTGDREQGTGDRGQGTGDSLRFAGGPLFSHRHPHLVILRAGHADLAACAQARRPEGSCRRMHGGPSEAASRRPGKGPHPARSSRPSPTFASLLISVGEGTGGMALSSSSGTALQRCSLRSAGDAREHDCMPDSSGFRRASGGIHSAGMGPRRHPPKRADRAPPLPGSFGRGGWGERASGAAPGTFSQPGTRHSALGTFSYGYRCPTVHPSPARVYTTRSWRRLGIPCQNSM